MYSVASPTYDVAGRPSEARGAVGGSSVLLGWRRRGGGTCTAARGQARQQRPDGAVLPAEKCEKEAAHSPT